MNASWKTRNPRIRQPCLEGAKTPLMISPKIAKILELSALPAFSKTPPGATDDMRRHGCICARIRQRYVPFFHSITHRTELLGILVPNLGRGVVKNHSKKLRNAPKDFPGIAKIPALSAPPALSELSALPENPPGRPRRHVQTWMYARLDFPEICILFAR